MWDGALGAETEAGKVANFLWERSSDRKTVFWQKKRKKIGKLSQKANHELHYGPKQKKNTEKIITFL